LTEVERMGKDEGNECNEMLKRERSGVRFSADEKSGVKKSGEEKRKEGE
jgi:hypothetical protein